MSVIKLSDCQHQIDACDANFAASKFEDVRFADTSFERATLEGASFVDVHLDGASFVRSNFGGVESVDGHYDGMTIEGFLVTEMLAKARAGEVGA